MADSERVFGRLEPVEIRSCWPDEARNFTPWLAQPEGLALLQESLDMELSVEGREVPVGPYSADIVARDLASQQRVVIENQLERTDHDHFGKALTYAAVLDARTIVWIARSFTDEHRKAVEWINELTKGALQIFGVQLQVWRIGTSSPAPRFEIVCAPNEVVRQAAEAVDEEPSETRQTQGAFWTEIKAALERTDQFRSLKNPRPQYWYDIALGRAGIHLSLFADTWGKRVGVRVVFAPRIANKALDQLTPMRGDIEKELSVPVEWNPNPEKLTKTVLAVRPGDIRNRADWPQLVDWMVQTTVSMKHAFAARVSALDLTPEPPSDLHIVQE